MLEAVLKTVDDRRDAAVAALKDFLSIPSVSTKPLHKPDMLRAANWIADQLRYAALDVSIMQTGGGKGHPVVVAKNKHKPRLPTVLFYGHYDVQPAEPLEQWTTPPFEPAVRNGALYARGAVDDKGQVWAHMEAILAWQAHGGVPVNLTVLIEGEEEIGSENLEAFMLANKAGLKADIAVLSDTNQFARGVPAICYGLRGLVYMEVTITGVGYDLHSGLYGGAVPNAANILCELLATLHDADGRVNIPGFYDDVEPLSAEERAMWQKLPLDDNTFASELAATGLCGEKGYSTLERIWARPTCDINGLTAGYQGDGAKTVIGAVASAKVSMRLVPNQDAAKIRDLFTKTIKERCPKTAKIDVTCHSYSPAALVPLDSPAMRIAADAMTVGFGTAPTFVRGGGSVPIVGMIKSILGIDTLLVGFGLPDDRVHSPNEKFDLDALHAGSRTAAALYGKLANLPRNDH